MTVSVSASAASPASHARKHSRAGSARSASACRTRSSSRPDARGDAPLTRTTRTSGESGRALTPRHAWAVADVAEQELPLVVVCSGSFVEPKRGFLALAANTHESAAGLPAGADLPAGKGGLRLTGERRLRSSRGHCGRSLRRSGRRCAQAGGWPAAAAARLLLWRRAALARHAAARQDQIPFAAFRHRILVFLAKEPALHQHVDVGGEIPAPHLARVEVDPARDLLAAKHELRFFFALRLGSPDGHRHGHEEHHDPDADQQCRHRVSALVALTTL